MASVLTSVGSRTGLGDAPPGERFEQAETLAKRLGVHRETVHRWERGGDWYLGEVAFPGAARV